MNNLQLAVRDVKAYFKEAGAKASSRIFNGTTVFIHHEDGSFFVFEDAFMGRKIFRNVEFVVVWSKYIEPFYFFARDLWAAKEYGDRYDPYLGRKERWKPIKVRRGVKTYLRENNIKFEASDFVATVYLNFGHTIMTLTHAMYSQEANHSPLYVFTEHHGHFCIKNPLRKWPHGLKDYSSDY